MARKKCAVIRAATFIQLSIVGRHFEILVSLYAELLPLSWHKSRFKGYKIDFTCKQGLNKYYNGYTNSTGSPR